MDTNKSKKSALTSLKNSLTHHLPRKLPHSFRKPFSVKQTTQHQNYYRNFTIACGAFLLAFIAASILAPVSNSSAEQQVLASIADGEYSVAVTGEGTVNLDLGQPSPTGKTVKATDNLSIAANTPSGYKLYVSMDNALTGGNRLYKNGNTSAAYIAPNQNSSGQDIPVGSETTLADNSWGFTTDATKYNNNQFAAMPLSSNVTKISEQTSSGNYNLPIYYGVKANLDMTSGNYSGNIVYTITSEDISGVSGIKSITPGTVFTTGGQSINITVKLFSSSITNPSQLGTITTTIAGITCPITSTTISSGNLVITCTAPALTDGTKTVSVSISRYGQTYEGEITYEEPGPDPTFNSISPNNLTINNSTTKVALNLTVSNRVTSVSDLGAISATIGGSTCSSPSSTLSGTTLTVVCTAPSSSSAKTSDVAITIGRYSKTYTLSSAFSYRSKAFSSLTTMQQLTSTICNNAGVGETASLKDSRGYGDAGSDTTTKYGVIKALDGNCWMTDNLNLYNKTISSSNSDTTSSFTIPASSNWNNNEIAAAKVHIANGTGKWASSDSKYYGQSYYNWCAATAQTSCSGTSTVTTSICPKNWNLPTYASETSTTNGDWGKLITAYKTANGGTLTGADLTTANTSGVAYPLGFRLYYGSWDFSSISEVYQGSYGEPWSATPISSTTTHAYVMDYYSSGAVRYGHSKYGGTIVRCVVPSS